MFALGAAGKSTLRAALFHAFFRAGGLIIPQEYYLRRPPKNLHEKSGRGTHFCPPRRALSVCVGYLCAPRRAFPCIFSRGRLDNTARVLPAPPAQKPARKIEAGIFGIIGAAGALVFSVTSCVTAVKEKKKACRSSEYLFPAFLSLLLTVTAIVFAIVMMTFGALYNNGYFFDNYYYM